ncbi:MAG: hypothetical protein PHW82_17105 [Bacteroidales bacterium]|nr:hypothetical protein [Bacteroidales bacterium]
MTKIKFVDVVTMVLLMEAVLGIGFALGVFDEKPAGPNYEVGDTYYTVEAISHGSDFDNSVSAIVSVVENVLVMGCKIGLAMVFVMPFLATLFGVPLPCAVIIQIVIYWLYYRAFVEIRATPQASWRSIVRG